MRVKTATSALEAERADVCSSAAHAAAADASSIAEGAARAARREIVASLAIVAVTFVLFVRERQPPEVIAMGAAALMMLLGLLPYDEAVGALSNSAPWTIAFMFIIVNFIVDMAYTVVDPRVRFE